MLIAARDFRDTELGRKDRSRLLNMVTRCRLDEGAKGLENAHESLERLERPAKLLE